MKRLFGGATHDAAETSYPVALTDAEWRAKLSPAAYAVLRKHATERAGTSPLDREKRHGVFTCAGCATSWPSFHTPIDGAVATTEDRSFFMTRVEVHCSQCGGHLGHVFEDGPRPSGLRYCINGAAMEFVPE